MKRLFFPILVIFLLIWLLLLSMAFLRHKAHLQAQVDAITKQTSGDPSSDLNLLKAQVQIIRDYNDDFLSTVYLAIGFVGTIFLALIGYSWFVNFRVSGRERDALKQELIGSFDQSITTLRHELEDRASQSDHAVQVKMQEMKESLTKSAKDAAASAMSGQKGRMDALKDDVRDIEYDFADLKATLAEEKKNYSSALTQRLRTLEIGVEEQNKYRISENLTEITKALEAGGKLLGTEMVALRGLLEKLPAIYAQDAQTIRDLMPASRM